MIRLLRAELLKLRTTRASIGLVLTLALISAAASAATVGTASLFDLETADFRKELAESAGFASLFSLLFGILLVTTEFRHATATPTFLATPVREVVIAAKTLGAAIAGVALGVMSIAVVYAVALSWLAARESSLDVFDSEAAKAIAGMLGVSVIWGAFGAGVGAVVRNQVGAIVGVLVWFLIAEPLVGLIFDDLAPYLPGAAVEALGGTDDPDHMSQSGGLGVSLAYTVGAAALGAISVSRLDVT